MRLRWWEILMVLIAIVAAAVALGFIGYALNEQPSCAERGGTPTTYEGRPACLVPGGIIQND